jgi:hypothetical protein
VYATAIQNTDLDSIGFVSNNLKFRLVCNERKLDFIKNKLVYNKGCDVNNKWYSN